MERRQIYEQRGARTCWSSRYDDHSSTMLSQSAASCDRGEGEAALDRQPFGILEFSSRLSADTWVLITRYPAPGPAAPSFRHNIVGRRTRQTHRTFPIPVAH